MSEFENLETKTLIDELARNTELLTRLFKTLNQSDSAYQKSKKIVKEIQAELERRRNNGVLSNEKGATPTTP